MKKLLLSICILLSYNQVFPAATLRVINSSIPLYEFVTLSCDAGRDISNPFINIVLSATFRSPDGRSINAEGFYNGNRTWLLRFMPDRSGTWSFTWQFGGESGSGSFTCVSKRNSKLHGHIRIDPDNPNRLRFEDGTLLHWFGGKYIDFDDPYYRTSDHASVPERMPKSLYLPLVHTYLQNIAAKGLNGIVLKLRVLPINDDLQSMDLDFLASADQIMQWCMDLGINVQLNFFDTWGKRKPSADITISNPDPADLLLEPHNASTYVAETRFYLRYLIARYAAYPNTLWELWNEAERMQVSASEASSLYASYFGQYDPYDIPISASEIQTAVSPLQITSFHAGFKCDPSEWNWTHERTANPALYKKWRTYADYGYSYGRPILWNELYPYDGVDDGGQYATNTAAHDWFRATFWGNFTAGCIGTSEFCWAPIDEVPNAVTDYHGHFAKFLGYLKNFNALEPANPEVECSAGTATMCRKRGKEYVVYHFTKGRGSMTTLNVKLPAGSYYYQFYDPKNGETVSVRSIVSQSSEGWQSFATPAFNQDIVLYLIEGTYLGIVTPVELAHLSARRDDGRVRLDWSTASESGNYGFEIARAASAEGPFARLAFVPGNGTTVIAHDYSWDDPDPGNGPLFYQLTQIDADGTRHAYPAVSIAAVETRLVTVSAYPNPGRGVVHLRFHLTQPDQVRLTIYNTLQQIVYQGPWQHCSAGEQRLRWDGRNPAGNKVATGLYFFRLEMANPATETIKTVGRFIYTP
jgi:hypothetical protein